ncbi:hypothetical protein [[Flexibacter] sp. ATCC 35103]|nr:hypothetical protein [[Flexibacter] sp. ATCC 35103]
MKPEINKTKIKFCVEAIATKVVNLESVLMAVNTTITGKLETKKT